MKREQAERLACKLYVEEPSMSLREVGKAVGRSQNRVREYLIANGIERRPVGRHVRNPAPPCACGRPMSRGATRCADCTREHHRAVREEMVRLYMDPSLSMAEVGARVGITAAVVAVRIAKLRQTGMDIPHRRKGWAGRPRRGAESSRARANVGEGADGPLARDGEAGARGRRQPSAAHRAGQTVAERPVR